MSEFTAEPTPAQEPEAANTDSTPEVDWKAKSREWEKRAKENKAAADKLTELEEAQKSAEQKAAERLAEAERRAVDLEFRVKVADIATNAGVPIDIASGPKDRTAEAVEAFVQRVTEWVASRQQLGSNAPKPDLTQGGSGTATLPLNGDGLEDALRAKLGIN